MQSLQAWNMRLSDLITYIESHPKKVFNEGLTSPQAVDRYRKETGVALAFIDRPTTKEYTLLMLRNIPKQKWHGRHGIEEIPENPIMYRFWYSDEELEELTIETLNETL